MVIGCQSRASRAPARSACAERARTAAWCSPAPPPRRTWRASTRARPCGIVVGFSSGGGYDLYARAARAPPRPLHSRQSDGRGAEHAGRREPEVGAISHRRRADRRHADHHLQSRPDHAVADRAREGRRQIPRLCLDRQRQRGLPRLLHLERDRHQDLAGFPGPGPRSRSAIPASAPRPISTTAS